MTKSTLTKVTTRARAVARSVPEYAVALAAAEEAGDDWDAIHAAAVAGGRGDQPRQLKMLARAAVTLGDSVATVGSIGVLRLFGSAALVDHAAAVRKAVAAEDGPLTEEAAKVIVAKILGTESSPSATKYRRAVKAADALTLSEQKRLVARLQKAIDKAEAAA